VASQRRALAACPSGCHFGQPPVPTPDNPLHDKCAGATYNVAVSVIPLPKLRSLKAGGMLIWDVGSSVFTSWLQQSAVGGPVTARQTVSDLIIDAGDELMFSAPVAGTGLALYEANEACKQIFTR